MTTTKADQSAKHDTISPWLLLVLALLNSVAPVATDLYLPAFPEMTAELQASATAVQLTLTAFLLGLTFGQLLFGPLSDRVGRRGPLIVGAVLCVIASALGSLARRSKKRTTGVEITARKSAVSTGRKNAPEILRPATINTSPARTITVFRTASRRMAKF